MSDLEWKTEKRKVKELILFDGNPRMMSQKQAEQLIESLKKYNYVELIAIDQNNRVIAGNMRVQALKQLGRDNEEIEVRVPNRPLTEQEARAYLLTSNKVVGEWDYDLLANFTEEELKSAGFTESEISNISFADTEKLFIDERELRTQFSVVIKCYSEDERKQVMDALGINRPYIKAKDFLQLKDINRNE